MKHLWKYKRPVFGATTGNLSHTERRARYQRWRKPGGASVPASPDIPPTADRRASDNPPSQLPNSQPSTKP